MSDLEIYKIPLGSVFLEKIDVTNGKHVEALQGMRDDQAKEMCYDVQLTVEMEKNGIHLGNNFLVKDGDSYVAFVAISHQKKGERTISAIVQEKMRDCGYGRIILTGVSDFLLNNKLASSLRLNINKNNLPSIHLAESCGFSCDGIREDERYSFSRKV